MKLKTLLSVSAIFIGYVINAQAIDTVKVNTNKQEIQIGKHVITSATKLEEITKILGPADRIEKGVDYIYDKLGISFGGNEKGSVGAVVISYNSDGDKKASKEKYTHVLMIDKLTATEKTNAEDIKQHTDIKEMTCMGKKICLSDPKNPGIAIVMGFNDNALVTQLVFTFTK